MRFPMHHERAVVGPMITLTATIRLSCGHVLRPDSEALLYAVYNRKYFSARGDSIVPGATVQCPVCGPRQMVWRA